MTHLDGMRRGLLALSALGVLGTLVELGSLRHWQTPLQAAPWAFLIACGVAIAAVMLRPSARTVMWARWAGLILAGFGVVGVVIHVLANMDAAPLDGTVGPTWDSLSVWRQLWMASTGGVGPAPSLAAASLTPTGLALALSTYRHEALTHDSRNEESVFRAEDTPHHALR